MLLRNKEIGNIKLLLKLLGNVIWGDMSELSHGRSNSGLIRQLRKISLVVIKLNSWKNFSAGYPQLDKIKMGKYS